MSLSRAVRGQRLALGALGLAAACCASLPRAAAAQVTPRPDTLRTDTLRTTSDTVAIPIPAPADSLLAVRDTARARRDSIKAPLATAPFPTAREVGPEYGWDRDALFASGAHTLLDLLETVPGVTGQRVGWLLPPETAAYNGSFGTIRIFLDGVELAPVVPRTGGLFDLSTIELWSLEQVRVERGAGELRVHLRSWRVRSTTPDTRTDVATGQYRTNQFRGFFGRRLERGEAIQFGFQQFSTGDPQAGGDGDQLSLMGRLGWAAGDWSMDAFGQRRRRTMTRRERLGGLAPLPALEGAQQFGYLRVGYRDPGLAGLWVQAIASSDGFRETTDAGQSAAGAPVDTADTTVARPQYVVAAGWNQGPLGVTATARYSALEGRNYLSPEVRAELTTRWASLSARAERHAEDSTDRAEVVAEGRPLRWLSAVGAVGQTRGYRAADDRTPVTSMRGEVGVRVGRGWLLGGALRGGNMASGAPVSFDTTYKSVRTGDVTAIYGGLRGPVWRDLSADLLFTTWNGGEEGIYRPQQQARAAVTLDTRWLSRFPAGQFGLLASGAVAYRSSVLYPVSEDAFQRTEGSTIVSGRLEIRVQQVVVFLESRNTMGVDYDLVPGYVMPRNVLLYGVRWQFWN